MTTSKTFDEDLHIRTELLKFTADFAIETYLLKPIVKVFTLAREMLEENGGHGYVCVLLARMDEYHEHTANAYALVHYIIRGHSTYDQWCRSAKLYNTTRVGWVTKIIEQIHIEIARRGGIYGRD